MPNFFNKEASESYDLKNQKLAPIAENMHFLIRLILSDLATKARILCVGVGTGAEILSLSKNHPEWRFVGVDPSAEMLDVCARRLKDSGLEDRCELFHGYIQDLPVREDFDAALSVLVGHFVSRDQRHAYYQNIIARIRKDGIFVNTEISYDLESKHLSSMVKNWEKVQSLMGANPESLASLPQVLKEVLSVLSHQEVEKLLQQSGLSLPVLFFQSFMISGWYGFKV